jgi:hypothetical protein
MLKLGGREFDTIGETFTIEWQVTMTRLLMSCGLADVTMHEGENAEMMAMRIMKTLLSSDASFDMLGCLLIPHKSDPLDWRPEHMRDLATFIRRLHTPEDLEVFQTKIKELVAVFFSRGILSARISPNYSMSRIGAAASIERVSAETSTNDSANGAA